MSSFDTILVPTDFGDSAELALNKAVEIARAMKSRIVLLHASPFLYGSPLDGSIVPSQEVIELVEEAGRRGLESSRARHKASGIEIRSWSSMGDPRSCILDVAKEIGANLIVMGTHGRHGVSRLLWGSTAEGVVRESLIPVLTVRAPAERETKEVTIPAAKTA